MAIEAGQQLLHYRLIEKIGEGGMGVVWKATDTTLDRDVAIKFLPDVFANDEDRLARFEREAKVLATLNHPNIASIYGLHAVDDLHFLAMEFMTGESLAQRLTRGPLPLDESLSLALQIAEGLEAAHDSGVVHRDLKPANIQIAPGDKVKVLDFGLAKSLESSRSSGDPSMSPTVTSGGTVAGVILGTAAYMSPEQARGRAVDKQSDVWSFGCVLYELLTGEQAFRGESVSDSIAGVLAREPDWSALPPATPLEIRELLRRCLNKKNRDRLHDVADGRIVIEEVLTHPARPEPTTVVRSGPRTIVGRWLPWVIAAAATTALAWIILQHWPAERSEPVRASLALPAELKLRAKPGAFALSPDGRRLVVVIDREGRDQLYMRDLSRDLYVPMQGTEGARYPFFSPDGEWVGFTDLDDSTLKRTAVAGGEPVVICDNVNAGGGSWGADDRIVFARTWRGDLWQVPASGGAPEQLGAPESSDRAGVDLWPQLLPGRSAILYTSSTGSADTSRVMVFLPETGERRTLVEHAVFGRYAFSGHLLFVRDSTLFAQPFDVHRLELSGESIPVLDAVAVWDSAGRAAFAVSREGTLAYLSHSLMYALHELVWVDRQGAERTIAHRPGVLFEPSLSPDGGRLAVCAGDPNMDVWVHDFARENWMRLTTEAQEDCGPIWAADGRRLIYYGSVPQYDVFSRPADGSRAAEPLYSDERDKTPTSVSPDGTTLLYNADSHGDTGLDIWQVPLHGEGEPSPVVQTPFQEFGAAFSRDGNWIAFVSNETGEPEVYVDAFPDSRGKIRISHGGGGIPGWSKDGKELFYRSGQKMMAVDVETAPTLTVGKPQVLFEGRYLSQLFNRDFDVAADGRFVMVKTPEERVPRQVNIILNWFDELERLAPTE